MPSMSILLKIICSTFIPINLFIGCTATSGRSFLPGISEYNEKNKELIVLDERLLEISGIFYLPDGRFAGINDEEGKIFTINIKDGTFETIEYEGKGDYEDIVSIGDYYYVMESDGKIHKVGKSPPFQATSIKFMKGLKIEFESLYFDSAAKKLVLVSKDHRNSGREIITYAFDLATETFSEQPYYRIPMEAVYERLGDNTIESKPSAAAVHPIEKKVFIIASVGKALIKCSLQGKVEQVYRINPSQFPQPEGITFAPNGDMYISNEGLQGKATILKFPYGINEY